LGNKKKKKTRNDYVRGTALGGTQGDHKRSDGKMINKVASVCQRINNYKKN